MYNILVDWETGEKTYEPLSILAADDPVTYATYAKENELGGLNILELWRDDIWNAYLEAYTHVKLFIIAGPEFEQLEGFILIFNKALYCLKSSGKSWADRFYDMIKDMGFMPSKAYKSILMRENQKLKSYEYETTYVDDLCIAAQNPGKIIQTPK